MAPTLRNGDLLICRPPQPDKIVRVISSFSPSQARPGTSFTASSPKPGAAFTPEAIKSRLKIHGFVEPDRICGVCHRIERRERAIRLLGGSTGMLYIHFLPWRKKLNAWMRSSIRPLYHHFCRDLIWKRFTTHLLKPQIVSFQRPEGVEWKLIWKRREIGRLPIGKASWQIRKPYLLFVNEATLPQRDNAMTGQRRDFIESFLFAPSGCGHEDADQFVGPPQGRDIIASALREDVAPALYYLLRKNGGTCLLAADTVQALARLFEANLIFNLACAGNFSSC